MYNPQDAESTPRPSHQISPAELRDRLPSFSTTSGLSATESTNTMATLASYQAEIASQQNKINETVQRLTRSVQSLSDSAIDPAHIREITDKLHLLSMDSPVLRPGQLPANPSRFVPSQYNIGRYQQDPYRQTHARQQGNVPDRVIGQSRFPSFPVSSSRFDRQSDRQPQSFVDNNTEQPALNPIIDPVRHVGQIEFFFFFFNLDQLINIFLSS